MRLSWEYKKIGDICTVERGGSPRPIDDYITDNLDGINWIKIGDTSDSMYITSTAQKIIPEGAKKSRYVQPGDFLLSNSMSFGRPYILKIDGCIHDGWLVLRDNGGLFDKRFLYYCLSAKPTYEKFKMMAVGGVVNNLNSEMVRKVEVPVPSITEQIEVADLLDKVHSLIEKRKQELSAFDDLIKARFVEMFGDPISNTKQLETDYLKDVLVLKAGDFTSASDISEEPSTLNKYPCYGGNGIRGYVAEYNHEGDYSLIGRQGALSGNVQYATGRFKNTEHALLVSPSIPMNSIWLNKLLINLDLKRYQTGAAQPGLSVKNLQEIKIITVPLEEQNKYASFVSQIDKSKSVIQKSLNETQLLFDSLMQQYFG